MAFKKIRRGRRPQEDHLPAWRREFRQWLAAGMPESVSQSWHRKGLRHGVVERITDRTEEERWRLAEIGRRAERNEAIVQMRREGAKFFAIAEKFGLTPAAVAHIVYRHGDHTLLGRPLKTTVRQNGH